MKCEMPALRVGLVARARRRSSSRPRPSGRASSRSRDHPLAGVELGQDPVLHAADRTRRVSPVTPTTRRGVGAVDESSRSRRSGRARRTYAEEASARQGGRVGGLRPPGGWGSGDGTRRPRRVRVATGTPGRRCARRPAMPRHGGQLQRRPSPATTRGVLRGRPSGPVPLRRLLAAELAPSRSRRGPPRPPPRPRSSRRGRSSRGSRGGASFARSTSSSGETTLAVLVLLDQLEADPAAGLVDLLDEHVEHVAALDHVLDVVDAARADVRDVQQPVGALLQLDERAEVGRLDDLAGELVADLRVLGERGDRGDRGVALRRPRWRRRGSCRPPRCRSAPRTRTRASGSSRRPCRSPCRCTRG